MIKIPTIVKISCGLIFIEVFLAFLYLLHSMISSYGSAKWVIAFVFGLILIQFHALLAGATYRAVFKRNGRDAKVIGILLLAFNLLFIRLLFVAKNISLKEFIIFASFIVFFSFNGLVLIYWGKKIGKLDQIKITE